MIHSIKQPIGASLKAVLGLLVLTLLGGLACRQQKPSVQIIPLEGKVEKVDVKPDGTGTITILYFNEKEGQEMADAGEVTRETEIMINGAAATLKDIQVGERVRGEVKVEKVGAQRRKTALKINVERALGAAPTGG